MPWLSCQKAEAAYMRIIPFQSHNHSVKKVKGPNFIEKHGLLNSDFLRPALQPLNHTDSVAMG